MKVRAPGNRGCIYRRCADMQSIGGSTEARGSMKVFMNRRWWLAFLLAVLVMPAFGAGNADASSMNGTWRIENLVLEIFDCQQLVCGRIVWIGDETLRPT